MVDEALSRLGSQADLYLTMCRAGATPAMLLWQVEAMKKVADQTISALRDADPNGIVSLDAGLSDDMRFIIDNPTEAMVTAPDDISALTESGAYTDDEVAKIDIGMIRDIARDGNLAVMVAARTHVQSQRSTPITDDAWNRVCLALSSNPVMLIALANKLIDDTQSDE